ncbi:UNKNOWN [Stylonychia lemnae]|uniref:Uncharacterized protein n=1 Tax=Stylonychia lemnae TaxID=5949 RepID=A0A078A3B2_STYLE|nr:UNKNOWN [Stylonychia lemnae]|eukprot:CDW76763.1 UNKNOWN [Stylonychia lemnae]
MLLQHFTHGQFYLAFLLYISQSYVDDQELLRINNEAVENKFDNVEQVRVSLEIDQRLVNVLVIVISLRNGSKFINQPTFFSKIVVFRSSLVNIYIEPTYRTYDESIQPFIIILSVLDEQQLISLKSYFDAEN